MENYTRFPIASLKWSGWTLSVRSKEYYNKSLVYLALTHLVDGMQKKVLYKRCPL